MVTDIQIDKITAFWKYVAAELPNLSLAKYEDDTKVLAEMQAAGGRYENYALRLTPSGIIRCRLHQLVSDIGIDGLDISLEFRSMIDIGMKFKEILNARLAEKGISEEMTHNLAIFRSIVIKHATDFDMVNVVYNIASAVGCNPSFWRIIKHNHLRKDTKSAPFDIKIDNNIVPPDIIRFNLGTARSTGNIVALAIRVAIMINLTQLEMAAVKQQIFENIIRTYGSYLLQRRQIVIICASGPALPNATDSIGMMESVRTHLLTGLKICDICGLHSDNVDMQLFNETHLCKYCASSVEAVLQ